MSATFTPNGTTPGFHDAPADDAFDAEVDSLYSWWAPDAPPVEPVEPEPAAPTCPEALFSLTLRGKMAGVEALLTVRGQSAAEFKANLEAVKGLLDTPAQPSQPLSPQQHNALAQHQRVLDVCPIHSVPMKQNHGKDGRTWYSHFDEAAGRWCKGR